MEPIPDEIRTFLDRYIESIDQLEILRILGEDPAREWPAAALAAQVQCEPAAVAAHAAALRARGLLASETRGAEVVWRHAPQGPEAERLVGLLLQMYKQRPVSMIKLVYARAKDPVRAFADAFRLRKEGG